MAPTTTLAGLALLLIGLSSNVAAQRTLQEDGETIVPVEDNAGHTYLFGYFEGQGKTEMVIPESDTHVNVDENGKATSIVVDGVVHTVEYDGDEIVGETTTRRTQEVDFPARQLQAADCSEECVDSLESTCIALDALCDTFLAIFLGDFCDAVDVVCSDVTIATSCTRTCATECDPALNDMNKKNPACTGDDEVCCPALEICEVPLVTGACGDPHMTGFLGQKFDFTGEDGAWYCLLKDGPSIHLNMRVTSPVPSVPEITYITGLSVITTDDDGVDHTIDIAVTNPHSLESSCPAGVSPCLADGALTVKLDGKESLVAPGEVTLGPGVAIAAANLPGACRSFGFEKYWERKKLQDAQAGRRLGAVDYLLNMGEWILSDPTATNMAECTEYVATALSTPEGLFAHNSEHASFQILTPTGTIRLSHGRLHQVAMRDPTDQFDLPEHLTWQMNVAVDHHDVSLEATGVLGETVVPTVDASGKPIMKGIEAIRGSQDEYQVEGPLGTIFTQGNHHA